MTEITLIEMANDGITVLSPEKMVKEYEAKGYKIVKKEEKKKDDK